MAGATVCSGGARSLQPRRGGAGTGEQGVSEPAQIHHAECVSLDAGHVLELYRDLGPAGAESVLARAMEEIVVRVAALSDFHRAGRWADVARRAGTLRAIAEQVGMTTLARVAGDVSRCAARGDPASLGATLARLDRTAHRSLAAMWDLQDFGN